MDGFIEQYLFSRNNITLIIQLLDIRHKPTKDDILMYNYLNSKDIPYMIIANKADKIAITKVQSYIEEMEKELNIQNEIVLLPFSTERKIYTEKVWEQIEKYV